MRTMSCSVLVYVHKECQLVAWLSCSPTHCAQISTSKATVFASVSKVNGDVSSVKVPHVAAIKESVVHVLHPDESMNERAF
jgi:hypothetical protein